MSPVLPDETIDAIAEVGAIPFAVFCKLLVHRNRQTGTCFPSINTIARAVGVDRSTIIRAIRVLESKGWVTVVRSESPGGRPLSNHYIPAPRLLVAESNQQDASGGGTEQPIGGTEQPIGGTEQPRVGGTEQPEPQRKKTPRIQPHKNRVDLQGKLRFSDEDASTAKWMFSLIVQMNPGNKKPDFAKWAATIRLTRERDGRTDEEIRALFSWANEHDFWRKNILCPEKLREKWDRLTIERNTRNGHGNGRPSQRNLVTRGALFVES